MNSDQELAKIFKVLAAPARITMIRLLKDRALCVGALAKIVGITPGAVSQHLQLLKEADLVKAEKRGFFMHYRINPEALVRWKEVLEQFLTPPAEMKTCALFKPGGEPRVLVNPNARNSQS